MVFSDALPGDFSAGVPVGIFAVKVEIDGNVCEELGV
jgi:hypothetical protein